MKLRLFIFVFLFICAVFAFSETSRLASAADNLLENSGFEALDSTLPTLWSTSAYNPSSDATKFTVNTAGAHSGSNFLAIENIKENDARWNQKVQVKANTLYKLSGWARADNIGESGKGANLAVAGILDTSSDLKGTQTQWQLLEMYVKTGKKQAELTFTAGLGGYSALNTGKAYFDDLALEEINAAPSGAKVVPLEPTAVKQAAAAADTGTTASRTRLIWWSILFIIFFIAVYRYMIRNQHFNFSASEASKVMVAMLCFAAFIRLLIAPSVLGYASDILSFMAWSQDVATNGLGHFYAAGKLADYPPGYMYVLYILGKLASAFGIGNQSDAAILLYKMPAMIADLVSTYLIFAVARKYTAPTVAIAIASLYAFNPAIILNSTVWGQIDSFFMLFVIIAIMQLIKGKIPLSTALFAVAVLIKPQALMFGPLLLFVFIRIRRDVKTIALSVVCGLLVLLVVPLPFTIHQTNGPLYLIDLYASTLGSYTYASLNAYNLIALTGGNWLPVTDKILFISYSTWSYILILASLIFCGFMYFKSKANDTKLYWIAFFFMTAVFMVTVKMHERYLFYALLPALMSYIHFKDRRILYLFFGLSLTHFFNADDVLANNLIKNYAFNQYGKILMFTSFANTVLFLYMIKVSWDLFICNKDPILGESKGVALKEGKKNGKNPTNSNSKAGQHVKRHLFINREVEPAVKLNKKDYRLIALLTLVYTIVALINLGSLKAPETFWQPANAGENFYADLGTVQAIQKVNTFGGPGDGSFKVEFSDDLKLWHDPQTIERQGGNVFAWSTSGLSTSARYVKVTAQKPGFRLNEIALYAPNSDKPLPVQIVVPMTKSKLSQGKPSYVFDEPDQAAYKPSYMNGTYFDEIYHARTAYEQLHQIEPYESTHPPLGKIIIGWGTQIFGMNPFGWRIMGTLFGILMIPILYKFAKVLFKKTEYAFISAFLLTFDFMHFVQTRISTIDVYGVFFIILMYYYMYRFYQLNFYNTPLRKTLLPLALSGLFFGFGAASKWIGIYAGAGLAVIFFLTLYERYKEYAQAKKLLVTKHAVKKEDAEQNYYRHITGVFQSYSLKTVVWCGVFFIIVPAVIYVLSYIPFMSVPGPGHGLHDVLTYQQHMYDYHKNLKATHPFSSVWWQWPIMEKPLWYYGGQVAAGKTSLIVALGNPAVWWVGMVAIISTLWIGFKKRDRLVLFLFIGMCANYLPWVPVPRLTFIYHFFAMVPFMIFCIVYVIRHLREKYPIPKIINSLNGYFSVGLKYLIYSYLAIVFLLFVMFYPILSGAVVDRSYVTHYLKWFSSWVF